MLPYHQRWRIVGKSLKWKWVWCYDVNCRGKRWVMYLRQHLKSQWGSYLLNGVINAIYYLYLSKWRNEIRRWWRRLAVYLSQHGSGLQTSLLLSFFVCNISIISLQITPLFPSLHHFSFGLAVSHLEKHFSFSRGLVKVWRSLFRMGLLWNRVEFLLPLSSRTSCFFYIYFTWTQLLHLWGWWWGWWSGEGATTKHRISICK